MPPASNGRPVAVAEPLPLLLEDLTEDQAVELITNLQQRELKNDFDNALELGDIVVATVRSRPVHERAAIMERLAVRTDYSVSTLKTRGLVSSCLTAEVRSHPRFRTAVTYTVLEEIALSEESQRPELFRLVFNDPPPPDAKHGRWRVNDIRERMGRAKSSNWTPPTSVEERRAMLLELAKDADLMAQVVSERENGISEIERAFFSARTPFVLEQAEDYKNGREQVRQAEIDAMIGNANLSNLHFVNTFRRRVDSTPRDTRRSPRISSHGRSRHSGHIGRDQGQLRAIGQHDPELHRRPTDRGQRLRRRHRRLRP
jgi:hypothetical protein